MDVAIRLPAILESAYARAALLYPPCGALDAALHNKTHRVGSGRAFEAGNDRRDQGCHHEPCVAAAGTGRDDLYDVQGAVSKRPGAQLGAASHVLFSACARFNMGRRSARPPADAEPAVPRIAGSVERDHGGSDKLVRRDIRTQNVVSLRLGSNVGSR